MDKQSLDDMWKEAMARFKALTEQNLKLSPPRTLEDIRKQIESQQSDSSDPKEKDGKRRAKDISLNALSCIKLLGGVAAQGASMAFGPAELCFNAVSLLLDIPSKIHEFHEAVDGLLDEVSVMLSQFKIYQRVEQFSNIDPELYETISKLMVSFVNICALSINLRNSSRWKRFRSSTKKVLFDDDSGVTKELEGFKALIQKQSVIRETVTLENVLRSRKDIVQVLNIASESGKKITDIAVGMEVLTTAEKNRKLENITKQQQTTIQKKLMISNDTAQASKTICNDSYADAVQRTGGWLRDIPEYTAWADTKSSANPLLLLTGDTNSGKTYLVSAIIHGLQSQYGHRSKGTERMPLVAYHYFPRHTDKTSHSPKPAETALKCMALQIAEQDTAYAKTTAEFCGLEEDSHFKESSVKDLWTSLKFVSPKRDITYFLIFDGLDQVSEDDPAKQLLFSILSTLQHSLAESDRSQIRVLASAKSGAFDQDAFRNVPSIDIEQHNDGEIRYYIDHELQKRDLLLGRDAESTRLRGLIGDKLPGIAQGNFFKVQTALEKIGEVVAADGSSAELEKILGEAGQDREAIARNVINALSESLTPKEIAELNELLIWVIFGTAYFKVDELKAALYLCFKTNSLQPLEKKIRGKYAKVFEIDGVRDVVLADDINDVVRTPESTRRSTEDAPKITATITITKADIKTVQNFLWNLTEEAMLNKFEFNDSAATIKTKGTIRVNEFDANLVIIRQSLNLLLADPDENTQALGFYTMSAPPLHLASLRDFEAIKDMAAADKREIGKGVFSLLVDGEVLEKHWNQCGYKEKWFYEEWGWFWDIDNGTSPFWRWLEDPDAVRYLGKKDKEWLTQLKSQPNPDRSLLEPVTLMVARRWLRDREWNAQGAFGWIHRFLSMREAKTPEKIEEPAAPVAADQNQASEYPQTNGTREPHQDAVVDKADTEEAKDEDDAEIVDEAPEEDNDDSDDESDSSSETSDSDNNSDIPPEAVSKAADWVQATLKIQEPDSLWFERLGETYSQISEYDSAIEAFHKAKALVNPSWQCFEGLALAHASSYDLPTATSEMEKSLEILRKIEAPTEQDHGNILQNLIRLADWEAELEQNELAINHYEEALLMDPNNSEAQAKTLKLMLNIGHDERARQLLENMNKTKAKDADLSQLAANFQQLLSEDRSAIIFSMIFLVTQKTPFFTNLLEDLDYAIEFARNEERTYDLAMLLLNKGVAVYHYDQREERLPESALSIWEEAGTLEAKEEPWRLLPITMRAFRLISSHHLNQALISSNPGPHIEKLEQTSTRRFGTGFMDSYARSYLGSYYAAIGDRQKTKTVLMGDMKSALALLSDDVDENDYQGYLYMADILLHSGDMLNALTAWSLLGPTDGYLESPAQDEDTPGQTATAPSTNGEAHEDSDEETDEEEEEEQEEGVEEVEEEEEEKDAEDDSESEDEETGPLSHDDRSGDLGNQCDGYCGRFWQYADDFYCCKICPDMQMCIDCLGQLKAGTLKRWVCSPKHDWLHVPKWEDEQFKEVREGKVKIGGELKDGVRVGGSIVTKEEWLDLVRDDWGIPRLESKVPATGELLALVVNGTDGLAVAPDE